MKYVAPTLLLVLAACSGMVPENYFVHQPYIKRANALYENQMYEEAIAEAEAGLLETVPNGLPKLRAMAEDNMQELRIVRTMANLQLGNIEQVEAEWQRAKTDASDDHIRLSFDLAREYSQRQEPKLAVDILMEHVGPSPREIIMQSLEEIDIAETYFGGGSFDVYYQPELDEAYAQKMQAITEQLAEILYQNHASTDALQALVDIQKRGFTSPRTTTIIKEQLYDGYDTDAFLIAMAYSDGEHIEP